MKTETKHTPGKWIVLPGTAKVISGKLHLHPNGVCNGHEGFEIAWPAKGRNRKEQLANAQLIASAPALLEACEQALKYCEYMHKQTGDAIPGANCFTLRAVIALATGKGEE